MRFKLSGFIYGMGTGIIILSLLYYTVYNFNLSDMLTAEKQKARVEKYGLSDSEIEALARGIGMVFPDDIISYVVITVPENSNFLEVSEILLSVGLIEKAEEFYAAAIEKSADKSIKSGDFKIEKSWGYDEILNEITSD